MGQRTLELVAGDKTTTVSPLTPALSDEWPWRLEHCLPRSERAIRSGDKTRYMQSNSKLVRRDSLSPQRGEGRGEG